MAMQLDAALQNMAAPHLTEAHGAVATRDGQGQRVSEDVQHHQTLPCVLCGTAAKGGRRFVRTRWWRTKTKGASSACVL